MTPERLAEIRDAYAMWEYTRTTKVATLQMVPELLAYVDELTRQRDDARRIAIDAGAFQ